MWSETSKPNGLLNSSIYSQPDTTDKHDKLDNAKLS